MKALYIPGKKIHTSRMKSNAGMLKVTYLQKLSQPNITLVLQYSRTGKATTQQKLHTLKQNTVKLDFKELLNKEQIDFKKLSTDYQLFYATNLLLNKELLPI